MAARSFPASTLGQRLAGALFCLLLATIACPAPTESLRAEDWPRWRGPHGNGLWQAPDLPDRWPDEGLRELWRRPIGGGYAGVVVVGKRVYAMDRQTEPEEVERILCLDADTGQTLWEHRCPVEYDDLDYGNGPRAAVTIHDGRLYSLGAVGHAFCLDAATGRVVWSHDFVRDHGAKLPEWGLAASPVIWRDLVILHPGVEPGGSLVALDRRTGQEVWRASDDPAGYATPIVIRYRGQELLVAWTPNHVSGLLPDSGEIVWSFPYEVTYGVSIATPIFDRDMVFVSGYWEGSKAIRLGESIRDATLAWEENRWLRGLMSQPLYRDGYVYLLDKHHGLVCFRLADGELQWTDKNQITPRARNPQATLVWTGADDDRVLVLNAEGELLLIRLSPQGFEELSRTQIIGPTWAHPAYVGDRVYARSDEEIVCVSLVEAAEMQ